MDPELDLINGPGFPPVGGPGDLPLPIDVIDPADVVVPIDVVDPADLVDPFDVIDPADLVDPADVVDPFDVVDPMADDGVDTALEDSLEALLGGELILDGASLAEVVATGSVEELATFLTAHGATAEVIDTSIEGLVALLASGGEVVLPVIVEPVIAAVPAAPGGSPAPDAPAAPVNQPADALVPPLPHTPAAPTGPVGAAFPGSSEPAAAPSAAEMPAGAPASAPSTQPGAFPGEPGPDAVSADAPPGASPNAMPAAPPHGPPAASPDAVPPAMPAGSGPAGSGPAGSGPAGSGPAGTPPGAPMVAASESVPGEPSSLPDSVPPPLFAEDRSVPVPAAAGVVSVDTARDVMVVLIDGETVELPLDDVRAALESSGGTAVSISGGAGVNEFGEVALAAAGVTLVSAAGWMLVRHAGGRTGRLVRSPAPQGASPLAAPRGFPPPSVSAGVQP